MAIVTFAVNRVVCCRNTNDLKLIINEAKNDKHHPIELHAITADAFIGDSVYFAHCKLILGHFFSKLQKILTSDSHIKTITNLRKIDATFSLNFIINSLANSLTIGEFKFNLYEPNEEINPISEHLAQCSIYNPTWPQISDVFAVYESSNTQTVHPFGSDQFSIEKMNKIHPGLHGQLMRRLDNFKS